MRSSLRTITNVNVDGQAIDCVSHDYGLSFKVNCDSLSWVVAHYYDTEYGTMQGFYYPAYGTMTAKHNGDTFTGSMWPVSAQSSPFLLGHDYTTIIYVFQNYPESSEHPLNTGPGKYDVLLGSGRIKQNSTGNEAYIDPDITSYMNPQMYEGRLIGGCMIKINGTLYLIKTYNKNTGRITLGSSTTADDVSLSLSEGQLYYLVSNYIQCDPFTWYCRSAPQVDISAEFTSQGIKALGNYSQAEEVAMQSYQFICDGEEGDKSFTYTFADTFPLPYERKYISVNCIVTTQENCSKTVREPVEMPNYDTNTMTLSASENPQNRQITLTFSIGFTPSQELTCFLWRKCKGDIQLVRTFSKSTSASVTIYDYTAANGKEYTYYVSVYDNDTLYIASAAIHTEAKTAVITKLTETTGNYHRKKYIRSSALVFDIGSEAGDINGNIGSSAIITESGQPTAVFNNDDYEQGTFTAYIDKLDTVTEPINSGLKRTEYVRQFFASKCLYLLQDNAGNSRVVTITNVSRSFDYYSQLTKISFTWTEVTKLSECMIGYDRIGAQYVLL